VGASTEGEVDAVFAIIAAKLMERLGIAEQLKDKTKFVDGVPGAEVVARGDAESGTQQINVILPVAGADYVGPLPAELRRLPSACWQCRSSPTPRRRWSLANWDAIPGVRGCTPQSYGG